MGRGVSSGGDIAERYSRRYAQAVSKLLSVEGEFVDDSADRGGATKDGISLRFLKSEGLVDANHDGLADFDLDMDGDIDVDDIRDLTMSDAVALYYRCFWDRLGCESFDVPIGEMIFDQAVNGGSKSAKKLLQTALNAIARGHRLRSIALRVDGSIGPATRQRLSSIEKVFGVEEVAGAYREAAKDRYLAIVRHDPRQAKFLKGWLARAGELGREA